eukprot:c9620_g1_i2.p1 GENE.c9620_g1_i2~~c9620_g1_i2.p1  ORF type:complete len:306 (+),score=70.01 c9620_g1_i2:235-1152(+)
MCCAKNNQPEHASSILEQMAANVSFTRPICEGLLSAAKRLGSIEFASRIIDKMNEQGLALDVRCYGILMSVHARAGDYENVLELFSRCRADGIAPNVDMYNILLNTHRVNKNANAAVDAFHAMQSEGLTPDANTYNLMIATFCRAGLVDTAVEWCEVAEEQGMALHSTTYNHLIDMFGRNKLYHLAFKTHEEMVARGIPVTTSTWNGLIQAAGWGGDFSQCDEMFQELCRTDAPNMKTFIALVQACKHSNHTQAIQKIYQELLARNFTPTTDFFLEAMQAYLAAGKNANALEMEREMMRWHSNKS